MERLLLAALFALAFPFGALAQTSAAPATPAAPYYPTPPDAPLGAPYNTGRAYGTTEVPLRDYLSSRIDQLRIELIDRITQVEVDQQKIMDERNERYAQRFQAQQEAVNAALQAAKEAVANALSAAKEAVIKAETAVEKRFESVNEFRQTLTDQSLTFMNKDAAEIRFRSLESKIDEVAKRLDAIANAGRGAADLWLIIVGVLGVIAIIIGVFLGVRKLPPPSK